MLEHLFGSRTRVKLLSLFLHHPEEALFVREITRLVGTQINAVRRELSNLTKLGLISEATASERDPDVGKRPGLKRKYYKVNRDFKLLQEVTALIMRAQVMLERRLDQEIAKMGDVRYLAFMGMFLGQAKAPVDLFVVGEVDQNSLKKLVTQMEKDLGFEINFSVMAADEFKYRKDMTDKFLYAILEAPKNVVIDRLAERPE
jgi:predicted transcriptional regulator